MTEEKSIVDFNRLQAISSEKFDEFAFELSQVLDRVMDPILDLATTHYDNLVLAFDQTVFAYCYLMAAHELAADIEKDHPGHAAHVRYKLRNYHFESFFTRWHSLLDYAAIFINELYPKEERPVPYKKNGKPGIDHVEYNKTIKYLETFNESTERYSKTERAKQLEGLKAFHKGLPAQTVENLKTLRNIIIHRYIPGFDHLTMSVQRDHSNMRLEPVSGRYMTLAGDVTYYSVPEFKFSELTVLAELLCKKAYNALKIFENLEVIQKAKEKASTSNGSITIGEWFKP